jgi:hypothetical protein
MIVEAKKISNGFFIPMVEELEKINKEQISIRVEIIDSQIDQMEAKHQLGYLSQPVASNEFNHWENEQVWGD